MIFLIKLGLLIMVLPYLIQGAVVVIPVALALGIVALVLGLVGWLLFTFPIIWKISAVVYTGYVIWREFEEEKNAPVINANTENA